MMKAIMSSVFCVIWGRFERGHLRSLNSKTVRRTLFQILWIMRAGVSSHIKFCCLIRTALRYVSFFMRRGGLKILWGGGDTFFSELKKGGSRVFPEFNIKYFF